MSGYSPLSAAGVGWALSVARIRWQATLSHLSLSFLCSQRAKRFFRSNSAFLSHHVARNVKGKSARTIYNVRKLCWIGPRSISTIKQPLCLLSLPAIRTFHTNQGLVTYHTFGDYIGRCIATVVRGEHDEVQAEALQEKGGLLGEGRSISMSEGTRTWLGWGREGSAAGSGLTAGSCGETNYK